MANLQGTELIKPKVSFSRHVTLILFVSAIVSFFFFPFFFSIPKLTPIQADRLTESPPFRIPPFNCHTSRQPHPVIANVVENLTHSFLYSLSDLGSLPEKPHRNIVRLLKGKPFRRPDISASIQRVLESVRDRSGVVVDVGANVGMASFAAAAMGFKVWAFEPVVENLWRICDGIWLNRAWDLVTPFEVAVSDQSGNITFHKLVGHLDNSAISASGAKLAFKSNKEIALHVRTVSLDDIIPESQPVTLIKVDVQGWEYHVLNGATKVLSRAPGRAPYLIYEEDERLLRASNSSAKIIRDLVFSLGYNRCSSHGTDVHCTKN